jgi:hypothetical protein
MLEVPQKFADVYRAANDYWQSLLLVIVIIVCARQSPACDGHDGKQFDTAQLAVACCYSYRFFSAASVTSVILNADILIP